MLLILQLRLAAAIAVAIAANFITLFSLDEQRRVLYAISMTL